MKLNNTQKIVKTTAQHYEYKIIYFLYTDRKLFTSKSKSLMNTIGNCSKETDLLKVHRLSYVWNIAYVPEIKEKKKKSINRYKYLISKEENPLQ